MANTKTPNPTAEYKVLGNLRHDGKGYAPGKKVFLTEAAAAPLLKSKVVEPIVPAPEKK